MKNNCTRNALRGSACGTAQADYQPLTARLIWQEIAPHTWPAAILPVLLSVALSMHLPHQALSGLFAPMSPASDSGIDLINVFVLLAICILMQSSVNVFNDYYDYIKGVDTIENSSADRSDAVLVYNNINPKSALALAVGLLASAFLAGMYIVAIAGWIPLILGVVGALFVGLYSGGKTPISYYPIGEAVSGIVMGGLITVACTYVLTGTFDILVLLWSVPVVIGIGLIMMTNNTCDIEKDREAERKTLSALIGREKAKSAYHAAIIVWMTVIAIFVIVVPCMYALVEFHQGASVLLGPGAEASGETTKALLGALRSGANGAMIVPFMILTAYPQVKALWKNPLNASSRDIAMPQCLTLNITLGLFYCIGLLLTA